MTSSAKDQPPGMLVDHTVARALDTLSRLCQERGACEAWNPDTGFRLRFTAGDGGLVVEAVGGKQ